MAKLPFDYESENIEERKIDELLLKRRCDAIVARIPAAAPIKLTPKEWEEFLKEWKEFSKRNPVTKKIRPAGRYDSIIRHLTALVNNKNLQEDHRRKYTIDRDFYKTMQKEARPSKGIKKKMFLERVTRDQVYDIVVYIFKRRGGPKKEITLKKCFDLAAQVWNEKHNGSITAKTVKTIYWNALNSNQKTALSDNS